MWYKIVLHLSKNIFMFNIRNILHSTIYHKTNAFFCFDSMVQSLFYLTMKIYFLLIHVKHTNSKIFIIKGLQLKCDNLI